MKGIVDWSARHPSMILVSVILVFFLGVYSYINNPKEGAPDIDIPNYFISVSFPGISAEDSESLLVRPLEEELQDLEGLESISATAAEGYAGINIEMEFGLDKSQVLADLRERVDRAKSKFPSGYNEPSINSISFDLFPVVVITLSGQIPERTLQEIAHDLKEALESLPPVSEIGISGNRDPMVEVIIDPFMLEVFDISANELNSILSRNNLLVAAGSVTTETSSFAVKIPSAFKTIEDVNQLVVKSSGDRNVELKDIADVRLTFEDRIGYARHNGEPTLALQVIKKSGTNQIDTVELVRKQAIGFIENLPPDLRSAINVDFIQDESVNVKAMIERLESAVLTAICVVMIIVLGSIGFRSAILVGFAIPSSFLICSIFLSVLGISISNIVAFGLILSVGMLVDSAIVVVELADKKLKEGMKSIDAYTSAAKRMFWPIISSTATTLCAFLPMLFWPGIAGQFMGTLPVTIIFVLSASLFVALVFLPVVGGIIGTISERLELISNALHSRSIFLRLFMLFGFAGLVFFSFRTLATLLLSPIAMAPTLLFPYMVLFGVSFIGFSISIQSLRKNPSATTEGKIEDVGKSIVGRVVFFLVGNPIMPIVVIVGTISFVVYTFINYSENNLGVRFFVDAEPQRIIIDVRARGNNSLNEQDLLVRYIENEIGVVNGVNSVFSTIGSSGLRGRDRGPIDSVGNISLEFDLWERRQLEDESVRDSRTITQQLENELVNPAGLKLRFSEEENGPSQGKPLNLRIKANDWNQLIQTTEEIRDLFRETPGLIFVEDTLPLPGIDWIVDIDLEKAASFGADIATIGNVIRLATEGVIIGKVRLDLSDDEKDVRVRFPEENRNLTSLENLRISTSKGLVPASNFLDIKPVRQVDQINRHEGSRFFEVSSNIQWGMMNEDGIPINPNERIALLEEILQERYSQNSEVSWTWTGDQEQQDESQQFLIFAFIGALGLMFAVLLAQFNSFYSSVLVLFAVLMSVAGVMIGLQIMQQPFSIIMTGTGVVALAGIVVNHNIVLVDTYNEYSEYMPRIKAIVKTIESRIRPVLLTSVTTIAGLAPMMFAVSLNFADGGFTVGSPSSSWWVPLSTAVIFGLGISFILTLAFTPAMLAVRVWLSKGAYNSSIAIASFALGSNSQVARDRRLQKTASRLRSVTIDWDQFQQVLLPLPQQNEVIGQEQVVVEGFEAKADRIDDPEIQEPIMQSEQTDLDEEKFEKKLLYSETETKE